MATYEVEKGEMSGGDKPRMTTGFFSFCPNDAGEEVLKLHDSLFSISTQARGWFHMT